MSDVTRGSGRMIWFDLATEDVEAAKKLYTTLFGWDLQPFGDDGKYVMWVGNRGPLGGVMQLADEAKEMGAPPHWMAYTSVADCDAAIAKAQELGATVLAPAMEVPDAGRFAILKDPQGAAFAVFASSREERAPAPPKPGDFSWSELMTSDRQQAWTFYSALFGWTETGTMDLGEMGTYAMFGAGGEMPIGGMMNKPADMPVPAWLHYVTVADCDASVEQAKALGCTVVNGPMDVPGGDRVAQLIDPQGVAFGLHSLGGD